MFGGAPPPLSKEELKEKEQLSSETLQYLGVSAVLLYLSPFAVDYLKSLV